MKSEQASALRLHHLKFSKMEILPLISSRREYKRKLGNFGTTGSPSLHLSGLVLREYSP